MSDFKTVIGLEVHIELCTKSKMFCSCPAQFNAPPNSNTCPVCIGLPGALPVLNQVAVEYAIRAGLALNCDIASYSTFDRKNYFYPDLPKAYQISQLYHPICTNGYLEINSNGKPKKIRIDNIHMEEDAGKLSHNLIDSTALIDYNRSGVPLLEIVTAPDFSSGDEAVDFLAEIAKIFRFLGISDCKIEEGSLRADVNLSVCEANSDMLGIRTEMKNLSSFKSIKKACLYESKRQIELLKSGVPVSFETRRFDEAKQITLSMRSKETADDYRYFPEPDIVPIVLSANDIEAIKRTMPELPSHKRNRYVNDFKIGPNEADIILSSVTLCNIFEASAEISSLPTVCSKLICTELLSLINKSGIAPEQCEINPEKIARIALLLDSKSINSPTAKLLLGEVFHSDIEVDDYIALHNLAMITDEKIIRQKIGDVLANCENAVKDYKSGKSKSFGFIVGQVMSDFSGKADPLIINKILKELLND